MSPSWSQPSILRVKGSGATIASVPGSHCPVSAPCSFLTTRRRSVTGSPARTVWSHMDPLYDGVRGSPNMVPPRYRRTSPLESCMPVYTEARSNRGAPSADPTNVKRSR